MCEPAASRPREARGIALVPDDPAWRQLELAFAKAQRDALAGIRARLEGDDFVISERLEHFTIALQSRSALGL
jgi:hypothetical protein